MKGKPPREETSLETPRELCPFTSALIPRGVRSPGGEVRVGETPSSSSPLPSQEDGAMLLSGRTKGPS